MNMWYIHVAGEWMSLAGQLPAEAVLMALDCFVIAALVMVWLIIRLRSPAADVLWSVIWGGASYLMIRLGGAIAVAGDLPGLLRYSGLTLMLLGAVSLGAWVLSEAAFKMIEALAYSLRSNPHEFDATAESDRGQCLSWRIKVLALMPLAGLFGFLVWQIVRR